jgi:hypothetical protein
VNDVKFDRWGRVTQEKKWLGRSGKTSIMCGKVLVKICKS